jgi:uncharacterized protein (TIGR03067 family)
MKSRWLLTLALPLCFVSAALADDKADAELEKGKGWKIVAMNQAGKDVPQTTIDNIDLTFTFSGEKVTVKGASGTKEGIVKIDASKTPKEMDLRMEGENEDSKAIYEIDDKTLKIALSKKERPKEIKSGPDIAVLTFERVK